jgi:hypothetical protein
MIIHSIVTVHEPFLQQNSDYKCHDNYDSKVVAFCFRKASQGGTGGGTISKSHHGARGNNGNGTNLPGSRGGWTSRGGSKNQLGPDKQHRQSGMLSSGKKGDQSKMPLSKSVWQHNIS